MKNISYLPILFILTIILIACNSAPPIIYYQNNFGDIKEIEKFIKSNAPSEEAFVGVQRLAGLYLSSSLNSDAVNAYKNYKSYFPNMTQRFDKIISLLTQKKDSLKITLLTPNINTSDDEYLPVISADNQTLYFTGYSAITNPRRGKKGAELIFMSKYENGIWNEDEQLYLGITFKNAIMDVSADGNQIIIFINGDLFVTNKSISGWTAPKMFPYPINTVYYDADAKLTSDGKAIIFTSDRPGAIDTFVNYGKQYHGAFWGNPDIYVTIKTDSGYSEPINLGRTINTAYAERYPFLHPDGKTLYFCSEGHYGLGCMDIFKSTRLSDTSWTQWSEPVNLGKSINSPEDDLGYVISTDGSLAYFSSIKSGKSFGGQDIYTIKMPQEFKPNPVATINGIVRDIDGNYISADIVWHDLKSGKEMGRLKSDPNNGNYFIVLPLGTNYSYYAEKDGYYPISNNLDLTNENQAVSKNVNVNLYKKDKLENKPIILNNIFFDYDQSILKPESYYELDRLVALLKELSNTSIEISGHTDNKGLSNHNTLLSEQRAKSVVDYLVKMGINPNRLITIGYGKDNPIADNNTDEGRAKNRRVEFKILK